MSSLKSVSTFGYNFSSFNTEMYQEEILLTTKEDHRKTIWFALLLSCLAHMPGREPTNIKSSTFSQSSKLGHNPVTASVLVKTPISKSLENGNELIHV